MTPPPDRDPAPLWRRALRLFQGWHPTLVIALLAAALWLAGAWHVVMSLSLIHI